MRDNHGIRYDPTPRTRLYTAPNGLQLHQKQTGEYFLYDPDADESPITPISRDRVKELFPRVTRQTSHSETTGICVSEDLALAIRLTGRSPHDILMGCVDSGSLSAKAPPGKATRRIGFRLTQEEYEKIDARCAKEGLVRTDLIRRLLAHATMSHLGY